MSARPGAHRPGPFSWLMDALVGQVTPIGIIGRISGGGVGACGSPGPCLEEGASPSGWRSGQRLPHSTYEVGELFNRFRESPSGSSGRCVHTGVNSGAQRSMMNQVCSALARSPAKVADLSQGLPIELCPRLSCRLTYAVAVFSCRLCNIGHNMPRESPKTFTWLLTYCSTHLRSVNRLVWRVLDCGNGVMPGDTWRRMGNRVQPYICRSTGGPAVDTHSWTAPRRAPTGRRAVSRLWSRPVEGGRLGRAVPAHAGHSGVAVLAAALGRHSGIARTAWSGYSGVDGKKSIRKGWEITRAGN